MRVADERDAVGDRRQRPLQARPRGGRLRRAAAGAAGGGDAVGGAGEVEQVRALGVVELQGAGDGVEHGGGGAGDRAALELGVVLHADAGERGDLAAAQAGTRRFGAGGDAGGVGGDLRAARHEELAHLGSVVHADHG